ncbi:MAG: hypothetical protein OXN97_23390 [Bryobacterales bacterium]|nr:hypothetical protein [Bryobacterales bacterium]MDE0626641.1 hypothetical protein [Bryobacterales bacterium]
MRAADFDAPLRTVRRTALSLCLEIAGKDREKNRDPTTIPLMEAFVPRTSDWPRHQTGLRSD